MAWKQDRIAEDSKVNVFTETSARAVYKTSTKTETFNEYSDEDGYSSTRGKQVLIEDSRLAIKNYFSSRPWKEASINVDFKAGIVLCLSEEVSKTSNEMTLTVRELQVELSAEAITEIISFALKNDIIEVESVGFNVKA